LTNVAFGGPARKTLYVTDSTAGEILRVEMDVAGMRSPLLAPGLQE
jgi:gluconolactonase